MIPPVNIAALFLACTTPTGGFPVVLDNLWLGEEESNAIATSLQPKLTRTRAAVVTVLHDVGVLEMALQSGSDPWLHCDQACTFEAWEENPPLLGLQDVGPAPCNVLFFFTMLDFTVNSTVCFTVWTQMRASLRPQ
eukprot:1151737-Pelagomonas_calceolata.AAC.3